ncbi:MAG TPA: 3-phosphoserine/phosphohydroxythreonine transaminase, partial [Thermoanaerobaculia bacterium]|nr:3-phosphoserine/phosphohydroxythreonine transaminase [Thermoanaerobaculia bacterium]
NVTFRLPSPELEERFVAEAAAAGLAGLKGHRSVGGIRASLYNAVELDSVRLLAGFLQDFARRSG